MLHGEVHASCSLHVIPVAGSSFLTSMLYVALQTNYANSAGGHFSQHARMSRALSLALTSCHVSSVHKKGRTTAFLFLSQRGAGSQCTKDKKDWKPL